MVLAIAYGAEWIGAVEVVIGTFSCMALLLWLGNSVVARSPSEADVFVSFDDRDERVRLVDFNIATEPENNVQ